MVKCTLLLLCLVSLKLSASDEYNFAMYHVMSLLKEGKEQRRTEQKGSKKSIFDRFVHLIKSKIEIGYTERIGILDIHPSPVDSPFQINYKPGYGKKAFVMHRLSGLSLMILHMMNSKKEQQVLIGVSKRDDEYRLKKMLDDAKKSDEICKAALYVFKQGGVDVEQELKILGMQDKKVVVFPYDPVPGSLHRHKDHFVYEVSSNGGVWKLISGDREYHSQVSLLSLKQEE